MSQDMQHELPKGAVKEINDGGSGQMFDAIASRYDVLNRIMSMGLDQSWRRKAVAALELKTSDHVLDLATGTGDLAIMMASSIPGLKVTGVDPSANMIGVGKEKVVAQALTERVNLEIGDGQALPFEDNTFDGAVVSFGIRNFPNRLAGLKEMCRVTRPGRKVVILELSEPRQGITAPFARAYIHHVVPMLGAAISGQKEYRYLQRSIQAFPEAQDFVTLMEEAGLVDAYARSLSFGAVHLYVGTAT